MKKRSSSGTGSENDSSGKYSVHAVQDKLLNLSHLQHEHRTKLQAVEHEYNQLTKFKEDYIHLQKRLKTLSDKTTHEVMVPFGPLAFMPGRLIHTNEILVLLGDNWFAERSAKEAVEIVRRRVNDCDDKIKGAETQLNIHKNWLKETSQLFEENAGQVEIVEELSEDEFERSQEEHRRKVAEEYEKKQIRPIPEGDGLPSDSGASTSQENFINKLGEGDRKAYEDMMRRLDQLEIEEDEESIGSEGTEEDYEGQYISESDIPEEDYQAPKEDAKITTAAKVVTAADTQKEEPSTSETQIHPKKKLRRRVSWADDKRPLHTVIPDDASKSTYRIKYTTKQLSLPFMEWDPDTPESPDENDANEGNSALAIIQSPSDIFKVFGGGGRRSSLQEDTPPRGILKKTISNPESGASAEGDWSSPGKSSQDFVSCPDANSSEIPSPKDSDEPSQMAFTYKIMERTVDTKSSRPVPMTSPTETQNKKISRFKAARMNK